jgi:hypothetical protein
MARRDVFLLRTETGWQVLGRIGGSDGQEDGWLLICGMIFAS